MSLISGEFLLLKKERVSLRWLGMITFLKVISPMVLFKCDLYGSHKNPN